MPFFYHGWTRMVKGKRQKAKGKRQKAKGKRQKAKGKRLKAEWVLTTNLFRSCQSCPKPAVMGLTALPWMREKAERLKTETLKSNREIHESREEVRAQGNGWDAEEWDGAHGVARPTLGEFG